MADEAPLYFDSNWSVLSTAGMVQFFLGILVAGITDFATLSIIPIVVSAAGSIANGLCFYAYYTNPARPRMVTAVVIGDIMWFISGVGMTFYSYFILIHLLRQAKRAVFMVVFWALIVAVFIIRCCILTYRIRAIGVPKTYWALTTYLHMAYFAIIALLECWSAFFLIRIFVRAQRNSKSLLRKSTIFRSLTRSTEIRVSSLCLLGVSRTIIYLFQAPFWKDILANPDIPRQLDRFVMIFETMFPLVLMVDFLGTKLAHAIIINSERGDSHYAQVKLSSVSTVKSSQPILLTESVRVSRDAGGSSG